MTINKILKHYAQMEIGYFNNYTQDKITKGRLKRGLNENKKCMIHKFNQEGLTVFLNENYFLLTQEELNKLSDKGGIFNATR